MIIWKSLLYLGRDKMMRLGSVKIVIGTALIAASTGWMLAVGFSVSSLYYKWSAGLLDCAYHQDYPLGRASVCGFHFGACFTDVNGGYATYCDGLPQGKDGEGVIPNTKVFGAGRNGCALSLCAAFSGESVAVLVPLPNFELP
jgi:hypothetical protein